MNVPQAKLMNVPQAVPQAIHDYAHKDCYNVKGKCRKINLYLDYEDALTLADDDINENWESGYSLHSRLKAGIYLNI